MHDHLPHGVTRCDPSFLTKITRKFSKRCNRLFYAKAIVKAAVDKNKYKNMFDFSGKSAFCLARILGIGVTDDDSTDEDVGPHPSSNELRLKPHRVHMARQKKRSTTLDRPDAAPEKKVRLASKDEVFIMACYDTTYDASHGSLETDPKKFIFPATGRNGIYDHMVTITKSVYRGLRPIKSSQRDEATAINSSTGDNDGADDQAPSLPAESDSSVPDKPFVRSESLESYRRARDQGLPEITRKDYNLLNYSVAITLSLIHI